MTQTRNVFIHLRTEPVLYFKNANTVLYLCKHTHGQMKNEELKRNETPNCKLIVFVSVNTSNVLNGGFTLCKSIE